MADEDLPTKKTSKRPLKSLGLDSEILAANQNPSTSPTTPSPSAIHSAKRSPTKKKGGSSNFENNANDNSNYKNVKEILLSKSRQGTKKPKNQTSSFHYSILCASLAIILWVAYYSLTPYLNSSSPKNPQRSKAKVYIFFI